MARWLFLLIQDWLWLWPGVHLVSKASLKPVTCVTRHRDTWCSEHWCWYTLSCTTCSTFSYSVTHLLASEGIFLFSPDEMSVTFSLFTSEQKARWRTKTVTETVTWNMYRTLSRDMFLVFSFIGVHFTLDPGNIGIRSFAPIISELWDWDCDSGFKQEVGMRTNRDVMRQN